MSLSVKVVPTQPWGPVFDSQYLHKRASWGSVLLESVAMKTKTGDPWSLSASQATHMGAPGSMGDCLKN